VSAPPSNLDGDARVEEVSSEVRMKVSLPASALDVQLRRRVGEGEVFQSKIEGYEILPHPAK